MHTTTSLSVILNRWFTVRLRKWRLWQHIKECTTQPSHYLLHNNCYWLLLLDVWCIAVPGYAFFSSQQSWNLCWQIVKAATNNTREAKCKSPLRIPTITSGEQSKQCSWQAHIYQLFFNIIILCSKILVATQNHAWSKHIICLQASNQKW